MKYRNQKEKSSENFRKSSEKQKLTTTECIAPILAQANIETTNSIVTGR